MWYIKNSFSQEMKPGVFFSSKEEFNSIESEIKDFGSFRFKSSQGPYIEYYQIFDLHKFLQVAGNLTLMDSPTRPERKIQFNNIVNKFLREEKLNKILK